MIALYSNLLVSIFCSLLCIEGQGMNFLPKRAFVQLWKHRPRIVGELRVLQYNVLADGLSGLRTDLGGFSRVKSEHLQWGFRKGLILSELLEHDADVITLQECDHYYDFFQPELQRMGYESVFAPKPASACLEVSNSSDGCAVFVKASKIRIISTEVRIVLHPYSYFHDNRQHGAFVFSIPDTNLRLTSTSHLG